MIQLWHHFFQDDLDAFTRWLAGATVSAHSTKGLSGFKAGDSRTVTTSSPRPVVLKPRKSLEIAAHSSRGSSKSEESLRPPILTRADINARDNLGLTLLHHAASSTSKHALGFVEALLSLPLIDLSLRDFESGWTPLHRALYHGHTRIAQAILSAAHHSVATYTSRSTPHTATELLKVKDHEGLTAFQLFSLTIASRNLNELPAPHITANDADDDSVDSADHPRANLTQPPTGIELLSAIKGNGDEVYAFGSNKNLNLGLGDADDRQYPERNNLERPFQLLRTLDADFRAQRAKRWSQMGYPDNADFPMTAQRQESDKISFDSRHKLPAAVVNQRLYVQDVIMSKLHTAVITNDPECNVYVCGFGPGGRLGTGDESTRFAYTPLQAGGLSKRRVVAMALGNDHSIAVGENGEVFTWGSNRWGQLGYNLPQVSSGEARQLTPRQLFGPIKKENIIGAAASALHSVIFTSTAVYTFGKNEGQLGLMDADARFLQVQIVPRRVGVSILQSTILQASAIDRATIILLETHEVMVLTHYGWTRLAIPHASFSHELRSTGTGVYPPLEDHENRSFISKIASGGNTICAITSLGNVFAVDVGKRSESETTNQSTTNPTRARNALPQLSELWSPTKSYMAAKDVAVGQEGSIILCTASGSVWRKEKRAHRKQIRDARGAHIHKNDYKFARVPNLNRIIGVRSNAYGAFAAIRQDCHVTRNQVVVDPPALWDTLFIMFPFHSLPTTPKEGGTNMDFQTLRFWTPSNSAPSLSRVKQVILQADDLKCQISDHLRGFQPLSQTQYNVWLTSTASDIRIPLHCVVLKSRSSVLRHAFAEFHASYYFSMPEVFSIEYGPDGDMVLQFWGAAFETIMNLAFYMYTDEVVDFWRHSEQKPQLTSHYRQIRSELMRVANQLGMHNLERGTRAMTQPNRSLTLDMEIAMQDTHFMNDADVLVLLAGGAALSAHREILRHRCPFFQGLFNGRAGGMWLRPRQGDQDDDSQVVHVNLQHVDQYVFAMVLRHIYADAGIELFDEIVCADLDEFIDFVLDVMGVSNELMLDRLSQICQQALGQHVTMRNVCSLLNAVAGCSVDGFKRAGLEYICFNLEPMLEQRLLQELEPILQDELDAVIQENQGTYLRHTRSGWAQEQLFQRHPQLASQIDQNKLRFVDSLKPTPPTFDTETHLTNTPTIRPSSSSGQLTSESPYMKRSFGDDWHDPSLTSSSCPPTQASETVFAMDEDNHLNGTPAPGAMHSQRQTDQHTSGNRGQPLPPAGHSAVIHERATPTSPAHSSILPASQDIIGSSIAEEEDAIPGAATKMSMNPNFTSWPARTTSAPKTDLKNIMAQATAAKASNLTMAINQRSHGKVPAKLSQRQRKKIQQDQRSPKAGDSTETSQSSDPLEPHPAAQREKSAWQIAPPSGKPLRERLNDQLSDLPPGRPRPALTMRQTLAGTPLATKTRTLDVPPTQPRNKSNPSTHAQKSHQPAIRSIRHSPIASAPNHRSDLVSGTMVDILAQQEEEKSAVREAAAKRSLHEIQQEQAFQEWWDHESKRVQEEESTNTAAAAAPAAITRSVKNRRARGGRARGERRSRGSINDPSPKESQSRQDS